MFLLGRGLGLSFAMLLRGRLGLVNLVIRGHVYILDAFCWGMIELRVMNYNHVLK